MDQDSKMRGLVRGAQMSPDDLRQFLKEKQLKENQPLVQYPGVTDEQWQKVQQKLDEVINRNPAQQELIEPEQQYLDSMSPQEREAYRIQTQKDFENAREVPMPEEELKKNALRKLRGR